LLPVSYDNDRLQTDFLGLHLGLDNP